VRIAVLLRVAENVTVTLVIVLYWDDNMWDDKDVHMVGSLMSFFLAQEYHKAMEDDLRRATFMVVGSRAS